MARTYTLRILGGEYAVSRLSPQEQFPSWAAGGFYSLTRTADELSVVCATAMVPESVPCSRGWRLIRFEGELSFTEVGVLCSVADPLAGAGISILTIATYSTDFVLVRDADLERARTVLSMAGHLIVDD